MTTKPPPGVTDPMAGAPEPEPTDPTAPRKLPDGSVLAPAGSPAASFLENNMMRAEDIEALSAYLARAEQAEQMRQELEAGRKLVPALEAQAKAAIETASKASAALAEQAERLGQLEALVKQGVGRPASQPPAMPAVDESGKPLGEFKILPVDPFYVEPPHIAEIRDRVKLHGLGTKVYGLPGDAGVGKTYGVEQWAAAEKLPVTVINCKGDSADDWIAYREASNGSTTWKLGRLTQAIVDAADRAAVIVLDEVDMAAESFKYLLLSILDMNPAQRRVDAPCGQFPVGRNVQFFCLGNATGKNPGSRHRGSMPEALLNRLVWIPVPRPTPNDLAKVLTRRFPAVPVKDVKKVGAICAALMAAAGKSDAGSLDIDVSIRTAIKVLDDWPLGESRAWTGALLGAIDDPAMRSKAEAIISTEGRSK